MTGRSRVARTVDAYFLKHPKVLVVLFWSATGFMFGWTMCLAAFAGAQNGGATIPLMLLWGAGGALIFGVASFFKVRKSTSHLWSGREPDSIEYRIDVAAASIALARRTFAEAEQELLAKKNALEQIAADAERFEALAGLSEQQAKAVDDSIRGQFSRSGRISWVQWGMSVVIAFLLGLLPYLTAWLR